MGFVASYSETIMNGKIKINHSFTMTVQNCEIINIQKSEKI